MPSLPLLRSLLFPVLALAGCWLLLPYIHVWTSDYGNLLMAAPVVSGVFLLILSQIFNQGRTGQLVLLVTLSYLLVQFRLQTTLDEPGTYWIYFWLTLLWPLNAAAIRYLPERRPLSLSGLVFPAAVLLQVAVIYVLYLTPFSAAVSEWILTFREQKGGGLLPVVSWVSFCLGVALTLNRLPPQPDLPFAFAAVIILHGAMFFAFALPFISVLVALLSMLLLFYVLLVSNHQLAFIDELTGLPGRRALMNDLRHRHGRYILIMADIDHFKQFNDTHGHDVGDDVLRLVASQLDKTTGGGRAYRYGGEEFTLLFPAMELAEVRPFIEATRERIASYPLVVRNREQRPKDLREGKKQRGQAPKKKVLHVTMSFGAARRNSGEAIGTLMKRADQALYKAKQNGRNRVEDALS